MSDLILSTADFQCPDSGWGCVFLWNVDKGLMWAEPCDVGIWETDTVDEDTEGWCRAISKIPAATPEEANNVLERYLGSEAKYHYFQLD